MAIRTVITRGYGNGTFNGTIPLVVTRGYAISTVVPFAPPFTIKDTLIVIQNYLAASGRFATTDLGEPESLPDGTQLHARVWNMGRQVAYITQSTVVSLYNIRVRMYRNAFTEPTADIEYMLAESVQDIASDLLGDFDLGATVAYIDAAGIHGRGLRADWGHAPVSGVMFRVVDMTIPIVVNDTSVMAQ